MVEKTNNNEKIEVIPNAWYPIFPSEQLGKAPVGLHRLGQKLVVYRGGDGIARCFFDRCPHRGVALSLGRVDGNALRCHYHGFRFEPDGRCTDTPCEGPDARIPQGLDLAPLTIVERHGLLWLWWGASEKDLGRPLPDVPWFDELPASTASAYGSAILWPLNHVRSIESNFDIHHAAFVHGGILPGIGTHVRDIAIEGDDERFQLAGTLARPGRDKATPFRVRFAAPTMTMLALTENIRFIVADCPIDAENTWRYARYYNDWITWPGIGKLIAWALVYLEWQVVQKRQDLPVVITQTPRQPTPGSDKLVRADMGTARYLAARRRLLRDAGVDRAILPAHVRATTPNPDAPNRRALPVLNSAAG